MGFFILSKTRPPIFKITQILKKNFWKNFDKFEIFICKEYNMKRRLNETIEIGDEVYSPRDEYYVTVLDIKGNRVLADGPMGKEYHNLSDLEKKEDYEYEMGESKGLYEGRKKIIRLTESDLARIVKRVIRENRNVPTRNVIDFETGEMVGTHQYGIGFVPNELGLEMGYSEDSESIPDGTKFEDSSMEARIMQTRLADRIMSPRRYGHRYDY